MREIKFRAWDKKLKKMEDCNAVMPNIGLFLRNSGNFEIMQFTGLKDKNGKEVYEGDIVQTYRADNHKHWVLQIKYIDNQFCMCFGDETDKLECVWYYMFEVIGNIYENPKLLKYKK